MHPFIGRAIPLHPCLVIYTFERLSCGARMEKLSALNFRLVSPETWKSWHWVSGNQELPPDFHLQSWQKFQSREIKYFKYNFLFWFSPISACMTEQWNWYECREIYYYGELIIWTENKYCRKYRITGSLRIYGMGYTELYLCDEDVDALMMM